MVEPKARPELPVRSPRVAIERDPCQEDRLLAPPLMNRLISQESTSVN